MHPGEVESGTREGPPRAASSAEPPHRAALPSLSLDSWGAPRAQSPLNPPNAAPVLRLHPPRPRQAPAAPCSPPEQPNNSSQKGWVLFPL